MPIDKIAPESDTLLILLRVPYIPLSNLPTCMPTQKWPIAFINPYSKPIFSFNELEEEFRKIPLNAIGLELLSKPIMGGYPSDTYIKAPFSNSFFIHAF